MAKENTKKRMVLWMPFIEGGSGADVSTRYLAEILKSLGVEVHLQKFHSYYQFVPWLLSSIKKPEGTNLILTNSWNGFVFARKDSKLVVVDRLCVNDPTLERYKSFAQRIYHDYLVKKYVTLSANAADSLVAVSNYTASLYPQELGLEKPQVILNAVDTDFFKPLAKKCLSSGKFRILFVGNLSKRKGVDLLGGIMQRLGENYELFYTAGLRGNALQNSSHNMFQLGVLNQEEMREQYQLADILLCPSRGEGLSRAVMESLACGTPVVATNISSMPEAVNDEVGALCSLDDVGSFVDAIKKITKDKESYSQMSLNARERAIERFSLSRMANEYIQIFERLVAGVKEG